jgi:hypothetical protein
MYYGSYYKFWKLGNIVTNFETDYKIW